MNSANSAACGLSGCARAHHHHDPRVGFFDQHAPRWDRLALDIPAMHRRLDALRERLTLRPGRRVLELGCGTGLITTWLADVVRPARVVAADFSPAMLEQARAKNIDAEFRLLDICRELPEAEEYDVVFCFQCFPHFRDQAGALRGIAHALKPGGRLHVVHLVGSRQINHFHRGVGGAVGDDVLPEANAWPALLAQAGLRFLEVEDREDLFLLQAEKPS